VALSYIKAYKLIGSRLLNDDVNRYLCLEKRSEDLLLLLPLPELGTLPPELRLSLSDIKLILRCYKVGARGLVGVVFVMGSAILSPSSHRPEGGLS
jgi:hypothetical protein